MHKRKDSFLFFLFISYQFNHVTATLIWLEEKEIKLPVIELCMMYCICLFCSTITVYKKDSESATPPKGQVL